MLGMEVNPVSPAAIADQLEGMTRRQQQFERRLAAGLQVDGPGLATMDHLMRSGSATPTELARSVQVSTAAMTLVLDRLEAAGHVSREPHPTDRRKVMVTPAPASVDAAEDLVAPLIGGVEDLVSSLSEADRAVVAAFLAGINELYDVVLASGS